MDTMNQGGGPCGGGGCKCGHNKVVPFAITLIGLAFLLGALNILTASAVSVVWPVLLIIAGGTKMCGGKCKCC